MIKALNFKLFTRQLLDNHLISSRAYHQNNKHFVRQVYIDGKSLKKALTYKDTLVFYTHALCPYAHRVWLTLIEKNIDFILTHIDLANKPNWYYDIHSNGLVPSLQYNNKIIIESIDICKWIDKKFGASSSLKNKAFLEESKNPLFYDKLNYICHACLDYLSGRNGRQWVIGSSITSFGLKTLNHELQPMITYLDKYNGPFLFGNEITIADLILFPFLDRADVISSSNIIKTSTNDDFNTIGNGKIKKWLETLRDRDSYLISKPDIKLYLDAIRFHGRLDFFDYNHYSLNSLHPHIIL